MLHFHAHLQITGIGWCESRCGRMCRGQQCPCFWRYLRLWFGKYVTFAPCRPLIGKRCAAFRNRARFEIELQVGWVQPIEKPARLAVVERAPAVPRGCLAELPLLLPPENGRA